MTWRMRPLVVGLVNNMPPAAMAATEQRFLALLQAAAPDSDVHLRLLTCLSLAPHTDARYRDIATLLDDPLDALIVTGAEPRAARMQDEPIWPHVARLADWAGANAVPVIWSCLSAHAAMLHLDGISRIRLPRKLSGVFTCRIGEPHPLTAGLPASWAVPHSRHHGLPDAALAANGYRVISGSEEVGADIALKHDGAPFLFLQGHPEYAADTLLREYRRDVYRYVEGKAASYPAAPQNYFDAQTESALAALRERAVRDRAVLAGLSRILDAAICPTPWLAPASRVLGKLAVRPRVQGGLLATRRVSTGDATAAACGRARMNAVSPKHAPASALFPDATARKAADDFLGAALQGALERVAAGPVGPALDMAAFRQALGRFDFAEPQELSGTLAWVIEQLEHGVVHMTHPRYFGLFNPSPAFPAQCADRIAAAFNPQLASATTSPAAVEIEAHVIHAVAGRAGLPASSSGHFTTGGSEANFTALICALTHAQPLYGRDGLRAFAGPPALYVSEDAHVAWFKIAHQAGIGRAGVHVIQTDAFGRMDAQVLAAAVGQDRAAGRVPVMIAATAGTTGAGMIDPLHRCADVARAAGVWLHVDAAWGGALLASGKLRGALAGIEAADSLTIDAHKWLAMTMGCGIFVTRRPDVLADCFHVSASFMPSNARHVDPYVTSVQWSRRFAGLRLFVSLAAAGWQGFAEHVEHAVRLTDLLRDAVTAKGWTAANSSGMAVLCLDPPPGFPEAAVIARAVVASNLAWVSAARFQGRDVVRVCITNGQTTPHDVLALADILHGIGRSAGPADLAPRTGAS